MQAIAVDIKKNFSIRLETRQDKAIIEMAFQWSSPVAYRD
jgi:hypothetical protein